MSEPASHEAVVACTDGFDCIGFRGDMEAISHPCLAIRGDADAIVPFELSGQRTTDAWEYSSLVSHAEAFNRALLDFLDA